MRRIVKMEVAIMATWASGTCQHDFSGGGVLHAFAFLRLGSGRWVEGKIWELSDRGTYNDECPIRLLGWLVIPSLQRYPTRFILQQGKPHGVRFLAQPSPCTFHLYPS